MHGRQVPNFLLAPDREICLRAVSLALLKVRALNGMTCEKLGKALECSVDTIRAASNEENLLSLDSTARLCTFFPDEAVTVLELFDRAPEAPTVADRLERIEKELTALKREAA